MKYIKVFENIKFGRTRNASINELTEDSKKMILNLFNTLNIPYDIDIYNHSEYGEGFKFDNQSVDIRNVDADIIRKILKVYFLRYENFYILKDDDKIDIGFSTGGIYSGFEISLDKREDDKLQYSIPIASFKDNKLVLKADVSCVPNNKIELTQKDLDEIRIKKSEAKYNI
jgi:hypothetical protein